MIIALLWHVYKKVVYILFVTEYFSNALCNFLFIIVFHFMYDILQLPVIPRKRSVFPLLPVVSNVLYRLLLCYSSFPTEKKLKIKTVPPSH